MKKITHSLVAMFALIATTAFAVDPVAVWSGDLGEEKAGFSFALNGNTLNADGTITMSAISSAAKLGVTLRSTTVAYSASTIIFEVEGMTIPSADGAAIVSTYSNQSGYDDYCGMRVTNSGETYGIWNNGKWGNTSNCQTHRVNSATELGAATRVALVYVQNKSKGTQGYMTINGTLTKIFGATGLVSTTGGMENKGWNILGAGCATTANSPVTKMVGAKLKNVAIFNSELSASEVAAYKFPAPSKLYLYTQGTNGGWGGNCNYGNNLNGITLPATTEAPAGTKIEVTKMEIAQSPSDSTADNRPTRIAIVVGNKTTTSADFVSGGTIAASGGNNPVKLTYNFPVGCVLTVGTQATIKWLKADGSEITDQIRYAASNDATGRFLSVNNGNGYSPIALLYGREPIALIEKTIDADKTWTALWNGLEPKTDEVVALTVSGNPTLTLDKSIPCDSVILLGDGNLTIAGNSSADMAKIDCGSFTGKLTFEIDASAGLTADDALKNFIRTASDKMTFVFKSTVTNKGAALGYGFVVNAAIHSHIVFDGGTHTMSYGYGGSGADGNCFGINASNSNPTVLVTGNATLNFTAKDFSYWTGVADINGVIRVNNGATLNFLADGRNTIYYRQRLCLEPGAKVTFPDVLGGNDSKPVMRFLGGTTEGKEVIYVLPPTGGETTATISGNVFLPKDDTHGFGVFVDANSRLKWTGNMPVYDNNDDKAVVKRGAGVFEYYGTMDGVVQVLAGSIAGTGSFRKLTLNDSATLNLDNGTPTVTGSLVTATEKQLKLAITSPVHGMSVITLPDAADKTGWTARVNGREAENELIAEGNTLKLKWKIPPTIELEADDVTIETADDWNGGVVTIDIGSLTEGDYKNEIAYFLKFGDKTVTGSAANGVATFELSADDFTAGNIYRGTFELEYGDAGDTITAADVIVYEGKLTYVEKDSWVNETPTTLKSTGTYEPDTGVSVVGEMIQINTNKEVTFTPNPDPDYVDKCDSTVTFEIFSGEEAIQDDDDTVEDGAQAGVQIVADNTTVDGVKFQFIVGDGWIDGPKAALGTTYAVTIDFHYAKAGVADDEDSVTYTVEGQEPVEAAHRAGTADKVTEIIFYDGTQFASLTGTCDIEVADPVEKETGLAPGANGKELKATDETAAQAEAEKIPVLVPSEVEVDLTKGLDEAAAKEAKEKYKAWFQVVAKPGESGKWVASVVPTEEAEETAEKEVQKVSTDVLAEVTALTGDQTEGTATISEAVPGFFYGVAENGEVVNMKTAEPEEWKMAGASGKVELKVTKPANAKARFYKVICTPVKPATK